MPILNAGGEILSNSGLIAMSDGGVMRLEGEDVAEENDDDDDDESLGKTKDVVALRGKFLNSA